MPHICFEVEVAFTISISAEAESQRHGKKGVDAEAAASNLRLGIFPKGI